MEGRGIFYKDHPMVLSYQRNCKTVFDMPMYHDSISSLVCKTVNYGSRVDTDEYASYSPLKEHGVKHECVSHSRREYTKADEIRVNNCKCRTNLQKMWLSKFMGVNKFNLQRYTKTFQFLHNNRDMHIYEKFKKILSILVILTIFYIMSDFLNYLIFIKSGYKYSNGGIFLTYLGFLWCFRGFVYYAKMDLLKKLII